MLDLTPAEWTAVALSLRIAVVATACALPFGIAIGWLLARTNFWGKSVLDGIVFLPLVMPPVVTGYLLLIWFGRKAPIGGFLDSHFGIVFSFRWTGAALACGIMGFPLMVRPIRLALEAIDAGLEIVPILNKVDLPAAEPERIRQQIEDVIGIDARNAILISAKTGQNVPEVLEAIVTRLPAPKGDRDAPLKALLVDSWYDTYLGVVVLVRVVDGSLRKHQRIRMMRTNAA